MELNELSKTLTDSARDQLDNLKAVKGEGFATLVAELMQMHSISVIVGHAISGGGPATILAASSLAELQSRYMTLVQEKVGLADKPEAVGECVEWANRILDSGKRVVEAALATKPEGDSLH